MLCLPYDEMKCNYRKSTTVILLTLFGLVIFYRINTTLSEIAVQNLVLGLSIIRILLVVSAFTIGTTVFFIKQNHFLRNQINTHQKLTQELCHQRDFDILSGLKNRNSFMRFAQQVEKRGELVSVMVCDIDGLKVINDTLGHMAGDKIIQKTAEILSKACPSNGHIFRMGGDEYLVIIQEVLPEQELMKLRHSIKKLVASYNADPPSIPLSISIGFAISSVNLGTFWEVSKQADHNMYQEKRACQEKVYNHLRAALIE